MKPDGASSVRTVLCRHGRPTRCHLYHKKTPVQSAAATDQRSHFPAHAARRAIDDGAAERIGVLPCLVVDDPGQGAIVLRLFILAPGRPLPRMAPGVITATANQSSPALLVDDTGIQKLLFHVLGDQFL
jgi:hypothetical protein